MKNQAFSRFPQEIQQRLLKAGHFLDLPVTRDLYRAGYELGHVYFLTEGMASIVIEVEDGQSVEAGMIGSEGVVGLPALLGSPVMKRHCFMQIAGSGLCVPLPAMLACFEADARVRSTVQAILLSQLTIAEQVAACNRLHTANARLARWILMASDRAHREQLDLTQEFLSQMLGTMRTTVALVAGEMQRAHAIEYSRGRIRILNRTVLTGIACPCYQIIRAAGLEAITPHELSAAYT